VILENFLSFRKDEVDLSSLSTAQDPRLILIIGPNWSGKTSIYQAIKFVFGSNERDDRYKKWSDFIRDGQEHAMVELHLELNDKIIRFRRIVIKGRSPYYELKQDFESDYKKVSAEEVQEIFSNLNINPDNHFAFVSQGKIDAIKNLKPDELCKFLEEGIGLKNLREDILKQKTKLEQLELNFRSMISKRNALNRTLENILPKLKRLDKKQILIKTKKQLQDELLWANRKEILLIISRFENQLGSLKSKIKGFKKKIIDSENLLHQIQININGLETEINSDSEEIGRLSYFESDLLKKVQTWETEKLSKKQEIETIKKQIKAKDNEIVKLNTEEIESEKILEEFEARQTDIKKQINELIQEQNLLSSKIIRNEEKYQNYERLLLQESHYKSKIEEKDGLIKDLTSDANDIFQSLQDIEEKFKKNEWFLKSPSKELLRSFDKQISIISDEIFDKESKMNKLVNRKSKKLESLRKAQQSFDKCKVIIPTNIIILKEEIQKQHLKVKGPIIDYLKYNDELSYAIESIMGEKVLFGFIASDWQTFSQLKVLKDRLNAFCNLYLPKKNLISPLREIDFPGIIGYLSELIEVINNDLDIRKVLYSKVGNCLVIQEFDDAQKIYKNTNFRGRCVTVKGEQISSYKHVFEAPFLKRLKGFLSSATLKEHIDLIGKEIKSLDENIAQLRSMIAKQDKELKEIFNKKEIFNDLLYNFNQKKRLNERRNEIYEKIFSLENEKSRLLTDLDANQVKLKELNAQIEPNYKKWKTRIVEIPGLLENLSTGLKKLEIDRKDIEELRNELNTKILLRKNEQNNLENEFKLKKDDFEKADKKSFSIFNDLEKVKEEIHSIKEKLAHKKEIKSLQVKEKNEIEQSQNQLRLKLGHENFALENLENKIESTKFDLKRIDEELGNKKLQGEENIRPLEEIKNELRNIDKELLGYLDVDETLLIEKEQILSSLKELNKNQEILKEDINSALNLEKKMEDTYFAKYNSELENLELSINNKFKSSGIKTYCSLNLQGDFETLGIDIKAAVSKDQLKSCTALSGGQISMISICLILSLQEIRPSPLCMFDEAAMFLDEKNTEISYQMIQSTLEGSQNQLILFLPSSSKALFSLADKIIGVARVGKEDISTIFNPKIIVEED